MTSHAVRVRLLGQAMLMTTTRLTLENIEGQNVTHVVFGNFFAHEINDAIKVMQNFG
jgi:hypothetical protein